MDIYNESNTPQNNENVAPKKQYKTSWYSALKENPEAFAKHKEYAKQKYEDRKKAAQILAAHGVNQNIPKIVKPHVKIDPEVKQRYNEKYYNTHKDEIIKYKMKKYFEEIKTSQEKLDRERTRLRLYQRQKAAKKKQEAALNMTGLRPAEH